MLVTDWYMPSYARSYKSGIFKNQPNEQSEFTLSQNPNHASNVIGWGEEGNTKYWIIRNSFGESFGAKGNIFVKIGEFMTNTYVAGFDAYHVDQK